jgi:hypothetical protein
MGWWGMECIDLAQDRDRWQALVNVEMNLQVLEILTQGKRSKNWDHHHVVYHTLVMRKIPDLTWEGIDAVVLGP